MQGLPDLPWSEFQPSISSVFSHYRHRGSDSVNGCAGYTAGIACALSRRIKIVISVGKSCRFSVNTNRRACSRFNPRKNSDNKVVCVSITNCTVGKSGDMELLIREPAGENFFFMSQYNGECELSYEKRGDEYIIKVPSINGWSVGTVFVK